MNKKKNKRKLTSLSVIILFILSFSVRILLANDGLFHHDSVQAAKAAEDSVKELDLKQSVHGRYGYTLINSIFFLIPYYLFNVQSAEATITFVTILFSSLAVVVIYLVVKELFTHYIGLISALIFSFNPVFLSVTTYAKSHGVSLFFVMLSFYFLIKHLKSNEETLDINLFFMIFMFSLIVRGDNIVYIPFFMLLLIFPKYFGFKEKRHNLTYGVLCLCLPFIWVVFGLMPLPVSSELTLSLKTFAILLTFWIETLTIPLIILFTLSFFLLNKKVSIFSAWILFTFLPLIFLSVISHRHLLNATLPMIVMIVFVFSRFKRIVSYATFFLIIFMLFSIYPVLSYRHELSSGKQLGLFVEESLEEGSFIILSDESVFIEYYSNKKALVFTNTSDFVREVNSLLDNHIYFYHCENKKEKEFILKYFQLEPKFRLTLENYHHSELRLRLRDCILYKLNYQ